MVCSPPAEAKVVTVTVDLADRSEGYHHSLDDDNVLHSSAMEAGAHFHRDFCDVGE